MTVMADQEVSKNALKKAQKEAQKAAEKAAKEAAKAEAAAAAGPKKDKIGGDDAEELDPTKYYENRLSQLQTFEVRLFRIFRFALCEN